MATEAQTGYITSRGGSAVQSEVEGVMGLCVSLDKSPETGRQGCCWESELYWCGTKRVSPMVYYEGLFVFIS